MRRLIPFLLLTLAASAQAQPNTIPNASFDVWTALDPVDWFVANDDAMTYRTVNAVGDARSGPFAAQMTVLPVPGFPSISIPPAMETCTGVCRDDDGNTLEEASFPVAARHEAFCGYYKANLLGGDRVLLASTLYLNENEVVAVLDQPDAYLTENAEDWTLFIQPHTFISESVPAFGTFATSIIGSGGLPTVGSTATLDDLFYCELDGTPVDDGGGFDSGDALLIIDEADEPGFADQNVEGLLVSLGFDVLVRSDEVATNADAADKELILISGSVDPAALSANYDATSVPLILWEPDLYDDLRLTAASDFGTTGAVTDLVITEETHPIAVGFALGDTTVYDPASPMTFGQPGGGAVTVGTADGQPVLFAYDDGAALVSGTAPARRVGFFADADGLSETTSAGLQLLENAILWAADLDLTVATEPIGSVVPETLSLTANYPNPFATSTTLEYATPQTGHVSLVVYDVMGRRVTVLADEAQAAGRYRATWNAEGLAAGVYVALLRAGSQVQTRRMLLLP